MLQSKSQQAKAYFSDSLAKSNYYVGNNNQELQGHYHGKLVKRIGVSSMVNKDMFFAFCENISVVTGKKLTPDPVNGS